MTYVRIISSTRQESLHDIDYACLLANLVPVSLDLYVQEQFTWDPQHEDLVRREWQQKVRVRLKDIVHKAAKDPPNKILHWMTVDIRTSLHTRRDTDEEFKKR